jgi:anti-anti-sigma factor
MFRDDVPCNWAYAINRPESLTVAPGQCAPGEVCALRVEGPLRAPVNYALRGGVRTLLNRGAQGVVVDLSRVTSIDAAGVGELARVYRTTMATHAGLRVAHATGRVRQTLERAGLFELLSVGPPKPAGFTLGRHALR